MSRKRFLTSKEKSRGRLIKEALEEKSEKVPRAFINAYLNSKGWRSGNLAVCYDCDEETDKHPIKLLWKHVLKGCTPCFDSIHIWNRQLGRYGAEDGNVVEHYRAYLHYWDPKNYCFIREVTDSGDDEA